MSAPRIPEHAIDPVFVSRWSPRIYDSSAMPLSDLLRLLEAARWAPSAYNIQPWRFLYSLRGDAHWLGFLDLLNPSNASWAKHSSALVVLASDTIMPGDDNRPQSSSRTHSFDAGAAWAQFALQAASLGYQAHAMAGIDFARSRQYLAVPEQYRVEIAIAVGRCEKEQPLPAGNPANAGLSQRRPIEDFAAAGPFRA